MATRSISVADLSSEQAHTLSPYGELLVFPTDTVYGIGVRLDDAEGIERLRQFKSRPRPQPFSLHLSEVDPITQFCQPLDSQQEKWMDSLLPGPYTVLLPAGDNAPQDAVLEGKIGIRVPDGTVYPRVEASFGPLLGTSVNKKGEDPLNEPDAILQAFQGEIALVIESDEPLSEINSAVIDLCVNPPRALRGRLPDPLLSDYKD